MTTIESTPVTELEPGKAYNVARHTNAQGQPIRPITKADWRAVLITADNLPRYADGTYYLQPIKDKHTPRLLEAGWVRLSRGRGQCGMEITTRRSLEGLACAKPAIWVTGGDRPMCAQHAVTYL